MHPRLAPLALFALFASLLALPACSPGDSSSASSGNREPAESITGLSSGVVGAPGNLAYSNTRAVYRAGRAIEPNVATITGSASVTFTVTPPLPDGLTLSPATGEITGTPTVSSSTNRHVVTAANALGTTRIALYLTVLEFAQELDPAQQGNATSLHLTGFAWGRLVDVFDRDPATGATFVRARNVVISESITSDAHRVFETMPASGAQRVTILHRFGTPEFAQQYDALQQGLVNMTDHAPSSPLPPPVVPRNAALVLRFDDLLDASTIRPETIELLTGVPATAAFACRIFPDRNHGNVADRDGDRRFEYFTTRVVVDLSTSELDVASTNQVLTSNLSGLPAATAASSSNVLLRLATQVDAPSGQTSILRNPSGAGLSFTGNGSNDPSSASLDVVRAFRSGGPSSLTSDPFEGFLHDTEAPRVLGRQSVTLSGLVATSTPVGTRYEFDVSYATSDCLRDARRGDVVRVGSSWLEVQEDRAAEPGLGLVPSVPARVLAGPTPTVGVGEITAVLDPVFDAARLGCFVRIVPTPLLLPDRRVSPDARFTWTFSEPLDDASVDSFETMFVKRVLGVPQATDVIVADATRGADERDWTLAPVLPLNHASGQVETDRLVLIGGTGGLRDAAGNALSPAEIVVPFQLDAQAPSVATGGLALRFGSTDELVGVGGDGSQLGLGKPELRGQFLMDLAAGTLSPRPVTHFAAVADRTQGVPGFLMRAVVGGTQAPLSRYGSKLQGLWRYCDVGFGLLDEATTNVDVEGISWSPVGGVVAADQFGSLEMRLSHSARLPDEEIGPVLLPVRPLSGLSGLYHQNVFDPIADPPRVVHPLAGGPTGYTVSPADAFTSSTGTRMVPWPMNRGVAPAQKTYYTWRDTALTGVGGAGSGGVPSWIEGFVAGTGAPGGTTYAAGQVRSIGLPLLMEFRCFPDASALGLNALDISVAISSSSSPNFRAHTTGGINTSGQVVVVDPSLQGVATGGFDPTSVPVPGLPTPPGDNAFYMGQLDLVVRVSRLHSIWFETGSNSPVYSVPVLHANLPPGTAVDVAYRGALFVASVDLKTTAAVIDAYGDRAPGISGAPPTFFNADASWKSSLSALNGARLFQLRVTLTSNAATGQVPVLDGLGVAYRQ